MRELRQATSANDKIGPFLDDTDGKTSEEALSIAQADIRLSKNGGDYAQQNSSGGATHDEAGWYGITLDATDTGTLGRLILQVHVSGALPVWVEYAVVTQNYWDAKYGTDYLQVDAVQVEGTDATDQINAACDTAIADAALATATALQTVDDNVDAILLDTGTDGVLLATGAVDASALADSGGQFLADHILKRNMATARASSDGDGTGRMALQALAVLRNKKTPSGNQLIITQEDDVTEDFRFDVTASAEADTITALDPTT